MDTLAVRLALPPIGPAKVLHLLGLRPAGRTHKRKGDTLFGVALSCSNLSPGPSLKSYFCATTSKCFKKREDWEIIEKFFTSIHFLNLLICGPNGKGTPAICLGRIVASLGEI